MLVGRRSHQLCRIKAEASTVTIKVCAVFVADLAAPVSSSELTALLEAHVPVGADHSLVQAGAVHVTHAALCVCSAVVLYEAESTWRHLIPVQSHHDPLDVSAAREEFVDLALSRVEGQVAHVQSGADSQLSLLLGRSSLKASISVFTEFH